VLGTTLWFVVALGLVAGVLMDAAASFARAGVHAAAGHAVDSALHDAVADYQNAIAATMQHAPSSPPSSEPFAAPPPLERVVPPDANGAPNASGTTGGPRFTLAYTVTPTTIVAPSCSAPNAQTSSGADAIGWLQCSGFVRESRMSLRVTVRVLDAAGTALLARRDQYVTLRLFAEPPYSAVVGRKDASADGATADALAPPAHEGDLGGDTVAGASPPPAASAWPAGGTLIHVRYECRDGAGSCANAAPPDPDADLRANARWTNGNQPPP
jgi:hypothetical protein